MQKCVNQHSSTRCPTACAAQVLLSRPSRLSLQIGVLNWFAKLWEIDQEEYWGYVTNCGTEGNLHGILVGRENLPDGAQK